MASIFEDNKNADESIKNTLERKLKIYGDVRYSYLVMDKKNTAKLKIISNYPAEWVEIYKTNKFQHIDPIVISALQRIMPFSWDENIKLNDSVKVTNIFNYSRKYNIVNGYTFILHDSHYNLALLSLMIDEKSDMGIEEIIEINKNNIQMLLIKTHNRALSMYNSAHRNESNSSPCGDSIFSKRENDILYWSSMGKTYQDISLIPNIKVATVKFHIGNVVKKLGVLNAKHAIRLGVELNLINPP